MSNAQTQPAASMQEAAENVRAAVREVNAAFSAATQLGLEIDVSIDTPSVVVAGDPWRRMLSPHVTVNSIRRPGEDL